MSIGVVFKKELVDHGRDKRTLAMAFMLPLLGPVLLFFTLNAFAGWFTDTKPVKIGIVGEERAPNLVAFLRRTGMEVSTAPADFRETIRIGKLDAVVVVEEGYGKKFENGEPGRLELYVDNSKNEGRTRSHRAHAALDGYGAQVGGARLLVRGVSPELAHPIDVEEIEVATSQQLAATFLNMIPMLLLVVVFVGGMHLAIDGTAGERERKSLEPLLVNPVARRSIVIGKWLATCTVTFVYLAFSVVAFAVVLERAPLADLGVRLSMGPAGVAAMLGAIAPLALLAASVQMLLALFAKTFKEAQLYLSLVSMFPMIPGMIVAFKPMDPSAQVMMVPGLAQSVLVSAALRGDIPNVGFLLIAAAVCLGLTALVLTAAAKLLGSERIVFGR